LLKTGLIVIHNGLSHILEIVLEGVYIVIARDVYAKMPRWVFMSPTLKRSFYVDLEPSLSGR
jgi:hypothetical protein